MTQLNINITQKLLENIDVLKKLQYSFKLLTYCSLNLKNFVNYSKKKPSLYVALAILRTEYNANQSNEQVNMT